MERVLHIGIDIKSIHVKRRQLVATRYESSQTKSAPCEDLGVVVIDHNPMLTVAADALNRLAQANVVVVLCNDKHMPESVLTSLHGISTAPAVLASQIAMTKPRKKRAWQQLVKAKIRLQASNLEPDSPAQSRLLAMADSVKSGDPDNLEAQAARIYWQRLRGGLRRRPRTFIALNPALDYGYALVRATLARSLTGVGLNTTLGFYHRSRSNPFCLADDLIEPLRPQLDRHVLQAEIDLEGPLQPHHKRYLLEFLTATFNTNPTQTFMNACHTYALTTRNFIAGTTDHLTYPERTPTA